MIHYSTDACLLLLEIRGSNIYQCSALNEPTKTGHAMTAKEIKRMDKIERPNYGKPSKKGSALRFFGIAVLCLLFFLAGFYITSWIV